MSNIQKLGTVVYMDDGKDTVATCELRVRDTNGDGLISNPQSKLKIDLKQMIPSPQLSESNDIMECNPSGKQSNIFSEALADSALKRMGIHAFPSPSLLLRNSSDYTQQIPKAALTNYVSNMSQAENLSRTYLGYKSVSEIKAIIHNTDQYLQAANRFADQAHANPVEREKFENTMRTRLHQSAAREIGVRAIVSANEARASENAQSPKIDEALMLLRTFDDLARKAHLSTEEKSEVSRMVTQLLSVFSSDGPI